MRTEQERLRSIRLWVVVFIVGLVVSGVTAFPLVWETKLLVGGADALELGRRLPAAYRWITRVHDALVDTGRRYPFLAYGTDWLAFGHLVIALGFVGLWRDPVRNRWLVDWGLLACAGVLPFAFLAGPVRGIPLPWRCIDASFGVLGCIPLWMVRRQIGALAAQQRID